MRQCGNFLDVFKEWTLPRSEVHESLILWAGLFTLAACIRRKVKLPKSSGLGGWDCYPFIYVMFVAPPGMRKTTTINYALELFEGIPGLMSAPSACSQASLSVRLAESPDTSCYIVSEEFSDLLLKSGAEMYEFLTSVFDARKKFETSTISRGIEFIENPCINMVAGSTPVWIASNMPESAIGGGFASRVIFIYENTLRHKTLFYENIDYDALDVLKARLQNDLRHIAQNINGEFTIASDAKEFLKVWYDTHEPNKYHPRVQAYYQRKHVHLLKVAQLLRLAYSDDLTLTLVDVQEALRILESTVERNLAQVFEGIGKNAYVFSMKDITKYIKEREQVSRPDILNAFRASAEPKRLEELIDGLIAMGDIKMILKDSKIYYESAR